MSGIYGDTLVFFSEQFQRIEAFNQVARVGSGYEKVGTSFYITGIVQTGEGKEVIGATGRLSQYANWKVLAAPEKKQLWTYTKCKIGLFIRYEEEIYVIGKRLDWSKEAGFYAYRMSRVIGDNGALEGTLPIKEGVF